MSEAPNKIRITIDYDRDTKKYEVQTVTRAEHPTDRLELFRILRSIADNGLELGPVEYFEEPTHKPEDS